MRLRRLTLLLKLCRGARRARNDAGFTLVEMSISLLILGIFMTMFTPVMTGLIDPALRTRSMGNSSEQLDLAFLRLDSQIRYASKIWAPYAGTPSSDNDWDVEFESNLSGAAQPTCTELQYNYGSGQLLEATWAKGSNTAPSFGVLASGLTGASDPFTPVQNPSFQKVELTVTLSAASGSGRTGASTTSSVTFAALNSTGNQVASSSDTDCTAAWTTA